MRNFAAGQRVQRGEEAEGERYLRVGAQPVQLPHQVEQGAHPGQRVLPALGHRDLRLDQRGRRRGERGAQPGDPGVRDEPDGEALGGVDQVGELPGRRGGHEQWPDEPAVPGRTVPPVVLDRLVQGSVAGRVHGGVVDEAGEDDGQRC